MGTLDVVLDYSAGGEVLRGNDANAMYMINVCVADTARRRSVGQQLVTAAMDFARETGARLQKVPRGYRGSNYMHVSPRYAAASCLSTGTAASHCDQLLLFVLSVPRPQWKGSKWYERCCWVLQELIHCTFISWQ